MTRQEPPRRFGHFSGWRTVLSTYHELSFCSTGSFTAVFAGQLWLIFWLLLLAAPTQADEHGLGRTIRIGIFPFSPMNFIDKDGSAKGLNPDLLREIFRDEATHIEFVPGNWAEGLKRLENEEIDVMMSVAYSDERAKVMDYGRESVLQLWGQIFARPEDHSKNISDLYGRKIAVMHLDISGINFIKTVKQLGGSVRIIEYESHGEVFQAVHSGEVDAGVAPQHFGLRHADDYNLIGTSILFSPFSIYFTCKKGLRRDILDHIDAHLAAWKMDKKSFYFQTLNRWMSSPGGPGALPSWLMPLFSLIVAATVISLGFIFLLNSAVKRKTRELKASEKRFRDIALNISDWIWETDAEGVYLFCSEHSSGLLGYRPEELLGRCCFDFMPPEQAERARRIFRESAAAQHAFRNKEQTFIGKDGTEICLLTSAVPIQDDSGTLLGFRGVDTDITARKAAENEKKALEARLAQAQKMEAVGTLAGGIAHDFNNILAAIVGYAELAKNDCPPGSETTEYIGEILRASTRARDLVKQIMAFSRQTETNSIPLQPAHLVKEAVKMLRPFLPATIEIRQNLEQAGSTVLADPSQLHQIVINLCTNAFHAMEEKGGFLDITLKTIFLSAEDLRKEPHLLPGPFIRLSVADSGTGMAPEIREKIFFPYFTTKEMGKGTGMGLSIVHGIVKGFGGFITCYSQLGEGTVFQVFLPVSASQPALPEREAPIPGGNECILFVDDEKMIAAMSTTLLENLGYSVLAVTDSTHALNVFRENPERFDLVITDQTMPSLTGAELAIALLQIRPELPIILCTGHSTIMTKEKAEAIGISAFAFKPLAKSEIACLVRQVLDKKIRDGAQSAPCQKTSI